MFVRLALALGSGCGSEPGCSQQRAANLNGSVDLRFVTDREGRPFKGGPYLNQHVDEAFQLTLIRCQACVRQNVLQPVGEALVDCSLLGEKQPECELGFARDELADRLDLYGGRHQASPESETAVPPRA